MEKIVYIDYVSYSIEGIISRCVGPVEIDLTKRILLTSYDDGTINVDHLNSEITIMETYPTIEKQLKDIQLLTFGGKYRIIELPESVTIQDIIQSKNYNYNSLGKIMPNDFHKDRFYYLCRPGVCILMMSKLSN